MLDDRAKFFFQYYARQRFSVIYGKEEVMDKWVCTICGYIYDPAVGDDEGGIPAGTSFEDLPDDWTCPICGAGKDDFEKQT
jgi:rubredoxin